MKKLINYLIGIFGLKLVKKFEIENLTKKNLFLQKELSEKNEEIDSLNYKNDKLREIIFLASEKRKELILEHRAEVTALRIKNDSMQVELNNNKIDKFI